MVRRNNRLVVGKLRLKIKAIGRVSCIHKRGKNIGGERSDKSGKIK